MMKAFISRTAPLVFSTFLLAACGGGGGGGDSTPEPSVGCNSKTFNAYLPLAEDTSINYDNNIVSGDVSCDLDLTESEGTDIYAIHYQFGLQALTLYVSSTANSIELYGIDGPIEIDIPSLGTREVDQLRFDTPVSILDNGASINYPEAISGSARLSGVGSITVNLTYDKTESDITYLDNGVFGAGDLPIKLSLLQLNIVSVKTLGITAPLNATINTSLLMAKGIGLVRHYHTGTGLDFEIESDISSVSGLPQPLWLDYTSPNAPMVATGSNYFFTIDGVDVDPADYTLVNGSAIASTGWLSVDANGGIFELNTQYAAALDSLSFPYSVQVIFQEKSTGKRLSTSVTIDN